MTYMINHMNKWYMYMKKNKNMTSEVYSSLGRTVTASRVSPGCVVEQIGNKSADGVEDWRMRGLEDRVDQDIDMFLILK